MISLGEAESVLAREPITTIFIASGLEECAHWQTIRWFADRAGEAVVIALLERCGNSRWAGGARGGSFLPLQQSEAACSPAAA